MKILFVSSEAHPLIKTGGLADVCGSLSIALQRLQHDVRILLPGYPEVLARMQTPTEVATLRIEAHEQPVRLLQGYLPDSEVPVYAVDAPLLFARPGNPYTGPDGYDWPDNAQRFAAFNRVAYHLCTNQAGLDWQPELAHCHDWQSGLLPALLNWHDIAIPSVFTIHNLSYQGLFPWADFQKIALPYPLWSMHALEFHNQLSFIKGGIVFADWITTVSPNYAQEIRSAEFGAGLDGLLNARAQQLSGILNGVDYTQWNPSDDPNLAYPYDARSLANKTKNKNALQQEMNLPISAATPLFGHIGRMVEQKGVDLICEIIPELVMRQAQIVILGSGDAALERRITALAQQYPSAVSVKIGYDEALAHRIEAGADVFLMPSRFEPCGLNQIYSQRYGTVPVVRNTGGLADTVVDATDANLSNKSATGFVFQSPTAAELLLGVRRALALYDRKPIWKRIMTTGMRKNFSWSHSAKAYSTLYRTLRKDQSR